MRPVQQAGPSNQNSSVLREATTTNNNNPAMHTQRNNYMDTNVSVGAQRNRLVVQSLGQDYANYQQQQQLLYPHPQSMQYSVGAQQQHALPQLPYPHTRGIYYAKYYGPVGGRGRKNVKRCREKKIG